MVIDKELIRKRFQRSSGTYDNSAHVQHIIARNLMRLFAPFHRNRAVHNILEIGCGTGLLTRQLLQQRKPAYYLVNDLVPEMQAPIANVFRQYTYSNWDFMAGDAEKLSFHGNYDWIVSGSTVQWFEHFPHFFPRVSDLLTPGGYFIFNTFAPGHFHEVRHAAGLSYQYMSMSELKNMVTPYLSIRCIQEEEHTIQFSDPLHVLRHMKETGVNACVNVHWNKARLHDFVRRYLLHHSSGPEVSLTYKPIYVIAQNAE